MSQSEGPATGGAAAPPRPVAARAPAPALSWEDTFLALAPHHQQSLLDLAARQGYLLADQVPGVPPPPADPVRPVLQAALAGRLPPVPLCEPVACQDPVLDPDQRDVVGRALAAPDLFVLQGPVGTGKTRVAVEIVRQAVGRGGKVLFLSPVPAALDTVLARLDELSVVRRLGPGEAADRLPPAVAGLVPENRAATIRDGLVRRSAEALGGAEDRARKAERLHAAWQEWAVARERQAARAAERAGLATVRAGIADEVRREAESAGEPAPFFVQRLRGAAAAHAKRVAALDGIAAEIAAARAEAEDRRAAAAASVRELKPKADALNAGRWYSPAFWKARFDGALAGRLAEAEAAQAAAAADLDEIAVREQKLAVDRQLAADEYEADRARFLDTEEARRQADLDARITELDRAAAADAAREAEVAGPLRAAGIDTADPAVLDAELTAARPAPRPARRSVPSGGPAGRRR